MENKTFVLYYNASVMTAQQVRRNAEAKKLLVRNGIKEKESINVGEDYKIIVELKNQFKKLEYPLIMINNKPIGTLQQLEEYFNNPKSPSVEHKSLISSQIKEDEEEDELTEEEPIFEAPTDSKDEKEEILTNEEQNIKDKKAEKNNEEMDKIIESKIEIIGNKKKEGAVLSVPFFSYPLHAIETGLKTTISSIWGISSYIWQTKNKEAPKQDFVDIPTLKTNWYGRTQKRVLRFKRDRIERLDSVGSLRASFKYEQLCKIIVTDNTFFRVVEVNGKVEFYQVALMDDLIDLFKVAQKINPSLIVETQNNSISEEKEN